MVVPPFPYQTNYHTNHPHHEELRNMTKAISLVLLFSLLPAVVAFVILPCAPPIAQRPSTSMLHDKMQNVDTMDMAPGNRTVMDTDGVAQRMIALLEDTDINFVQEAEEEFDPAKQIFDPLSFWTERSGRFPRNK